MIKVDGNVMDEMKVYKVGNFKIMGFRTMHDCAEPFGFLINHPDTGNILFATDTYFLPNRFANLSHILIEANYSDEIIEDNLRKGIVNGYLRDRTLESHMSLKTTIETLQANDLGKVVTIVLLHLSDRNSNAQQFKNEVWLSTGKPTFVAEPGLDIKITKTPW
jgi:phosphoribosyl 1,2-cyclic phosphodiesterase